MFLAAKQLTMYFSDMRKVKKFLQAGFWNQEIFAENSISKSQQTHKFPFYNTQYQTNMK